jgi:hypothetical protein
VLVRKKLTTPLSYAKKGWNADTLEDMIWAELKRYLSNKDLLVGEMERQQQAATKEEVYAVELERIGRQLKAADWEQHKLLQWALRDFPESQVDAENKRLNQVKKTLNAQRVEVEAHLRACRLAAINQPDLERLIEQVQHRLAHLDFGEKQLALEMLGITVWLDGQEVKITGKIDSSIVTIPS